MSMKGTFRMKRRIRFTLYILRAHILEGQRLLTNKKTDRAESIKYQVLGDAGTTTPLIDELSVWIMACKS